MFIIYYFHSLCFTLSTWHNQSQNCTLFHTKPNLKGLYTYTDCLNGFLFHAYKRLPWLLKLKATIQGYLFSFLLKIKLYLCMQMHYIGGFKKLASKSSCTQRWKLLSIYIQWLTVKMHSLLFPVSQKEQKLLSSWNKKPHLFL